MTLSEVRKTVQSKSVESIGVLLVAAVLFAVIPEAQAVPLCDGGEIIWDNGIAIGCMFAQGDWNSGTAAMCNGNVILSPTTGDCTTGDCYVCVPAQHVNTVLNGGAMLVGATRTGAKPRIFYCLDNSGYERLVHGECVFDVWNTIVSWYPMDETSGSTILDPYSFHDGTLNGATRVAGWIEGGIHFDGISDYVEIADTLDFNFGTADFSIDFWVKTFQNTGVRSVLDKRTSGPYRGWHIYLYNGRLGLQLADGGYSNYNSSAFVADGSWHHVAITVDRDNIQGVRFYVDGQQVGSALNPTGRQGSLSNAAPLRIATLSLGLSGFWNGTLDELGVHWGVVDTTTITALANIQSRGKCEP